jgi:hypothetical protein
MNHDDGQAQARLERLLAAVHAPADERILARARARILAGSVAGRASELPAWLNWLGHPAAVAAAALICVACGVASVEVWNNAALTGSTTRSESTTMVSTLLGDDGSDGMPAVATATTTSAAHGSADSGSVR